MNNDNKNRPGSNIPDPPDGNPGARSGDGSSERGDSHDWNDSDSYDWLNDDSSEPDDDSDDAEPGGSSGNGRSSNMPGGRKADSRIPERTPAYKHEIANRRREAALKAAKVTGRVAVKTVSVTGSIVGGLISAALKVIGTILLVAVLSGLMFSVVFAVYIKGEIADDPGVDLGDFTQTQSTIIYYYDQVVSDWRELETLYSREGNSVRVSFEDLPLNLINATIAIEDKRFEEHHGVDWYRTAGAFYKMLYGDASFGGSTITQQLIKNTTREKEVTVRRKMSEIFRALDLERRYTKDQIITEYLNLIPLGENCNGVGSAARVYFGKEVSELSLAECASLVGITNNPSLYDPYISEKTRERNKKRQELILSEMYAQDKITKTEYESAVAQKLVFKNMSRELAAKEAEAAGGVTHRYYSWFTDAVINDVITDLMELNGISRDMATYQLYSRGYRIYTTLDPAIQAIVDEFYTDPANLPEKVSKYGEKLNSSMVIMDPYTGDIVAMAGGIGEKVGNRILNLATDTKRQPGSSIKPIAVYAPAMDLGYIRPWTLVDDSPTGTLIGNPSFWPRNSDRANRGVMTIASAIQLSVNTVAVQVLDRLTTQVSYNFLTEKLHITTLVKNDGQGHTDIGYSPLGLGQLTYGLTTREATAAAAMFPNSGMYISSRTYSKIYDAGGNLIIDNVPVTNTAISEVTAYHMREMMKSVVTGGTGTEARLKNVTGIPVAGKTGTSGAVGDRWFVGYTPYYVAAVWTGYKNSHDSLPGVGNPSAVMFGKVMSKIHETLEPREFKDPQNLKSYTVCTDTGLIATDACRNDPRGNHTMTLKLAPSEVPGHSCDAHKPTAYTKLLVDTRMPDGTIVPAGTVTGTATAHCPPENQFNVSLLDPSKSTYRVPTPDTNVEYLQGKSRPCWVHPTLATYTPPPEETPPPDDNGGSMIESVEPDYGDEDFTEAF